MDDTVTTFGETTETWFVLIFSPLLALLDFLSGLYGLLWSSDHA